MKPTWNNILRLAYFGSKDKALGQRAEVLTSIIGARTPISCIKNQTVIDIMNVLKARGISDSTVNRYLSIISKVVSLYRRNYNATFTLHIPWQREGSGRFEWLRSEDEDILLTHLRSTGNNDLAIVVRVLTITGMRLGELLGLELSQVEEDWIRLWKTKTNRPRSVPIPADIAQQLRQLIERGLPTGPQIRKGLRGALKACGVNSNITPHSLRHTTATRLIKSGVNVLVAQRYLGHNSIKTTQRYVHIEDSDISDAMTKMVR
jgi:integrase